MFWSKAWGRAKSGDDLMRWQRIKDSARRAEVLQAENIPCRSIERVRQRAV